MTKKDTKLFVGIVILVVLIGGIFLWFDAKAPSVVDTGAQPSIVANNTEIVQSEPTQSLIKVPSVVNVVHAGLPNAGFPPQGY